MPSRNASPARATPLPPAVDPIAEPLHRCALHLLRLIRLADDGTGLSAARLSALSVLVFGGPCTVGALAAAERVSGPTMTRLVRGLEKGAWLRRSPAPHDARVSLLTATPKAVRLLVDGRMRRLRALTRGLPAKGTPEHKALTRAIEPLEAVVASLARIASAGSKKRLMRRPGRRRIEAIEG
jgi:DNA-binding MarR family transcriptional regulator